MPHDKDDFFGQDPEVLTQRLLGEQVAKGRQQFQAGGRRSGKEIAGFAIGQGLATAAGKFLRDKGIIPEDPQVQRARDLQEIQKVGVEIATKLQMDPKSGFKGIAEETVHSRKPLPHRPDVRSCRCEHHYVFSIHEEDEKPVIVAVLHENMNLIERIPERLEEE